MARGIDWQKAKKRQLVWERGGIPVWQDGWSQNSPPQFNGSSNAMDSSGDAGNWPRSLPPGPFEMKLDIQTESRGLFRFIFRFSDTYPEHRSSLPKLVDRLLQENLGAFLYRFDDFILFDYHYPNPIPELRQLEGVLVVSRDVLPRKGRHKRPPHLML